MTGKHITDRERDSTVFFSPESPVAAPDRDNHECRKNLSIKHLTQPVQADIYNIYFF